MRFVLVPGAVFLPGKAGRACILAVTFLFLLPAGGVALAEGTKSVPSVILDERCYWRHYYRFGSDCVSPGAMEREGEGVLGAAKFERLRDSITKGLKGKGEAPAANERNVPPGWTRHVLLSPSAATWTAPPPPEDWAQPGFDDGDWVRRRMPVRVGCPGIPSYWSQQPESLGVQTCYLRSRFEVPDPAGTGPLTLRLVYHGGVRVLVNGREVARGGLPQGALSPEIPGNDYPKEAYHFLAEDSPSTAKQDPAKMVYCPELFGRFEDAPFAPGGGPELRSGLSGRTIVPRRGWQRLQGIRDRVLENVTVEPSLLRKGVNVLAIEVRASDLHPVVLAGEWTGAHYGGIWSHAQLLSLELLDAGGKIPSATRPALTDTAPAGSAPAPDRGPKGLEVWVEDMHRRVFSTEYPSPGEPPGVVRVVGVPNGTHATQIVARSDPGAPGLAGLQATVGDLKAVAGTAKIPAAAASVSYAVPHAVSELTAMGWSRHVADTDPLAGCGGAGERAVQRHWHKDLTVAPREEKLKALEALRLFDHLSPRPPERVAAGSCQPIWLSWRIPADAVAGLYRGQVRVEAEGLAPRTLDVEVEVVAWRLPDPKDFQTVVAMEQSPYGVAKQYGTDILKDNKPVREPVPLWSDRHFELMEPAFRQLARVGNDWLNVPVLRNTEFGNFDDSPIRWVRRKDPGAPGLSFDYTRLDRYLDLAVKHLGRPRVINFIVMYGHADVKTHPPTVTVFDEGTGKSDVLYLAGAKTTSEESRKVWKAFAESLHEHLKSKGLAESMFWGYAWDGESDPTLKTLLAELVPGVYWTKTAHADRGDPKFHRAVETIYDGPNRGIRGWKNPVLHLATPRWGGYVHALDIASPAFSYRLLADRCLVNGRNGIGRLGADYWADTFMRAPHDFGYCPGQSVLAMFWPGPQGAESSARFEALLEGIQETEARIFLEQCLDSGVLGVELAKRVTQTLSDHFEQTAFISAGAPIHPIGEYHGGWQQRSRRLYRAAAEAAAACASTRTGKPAVGAAPATTANPS